MRCHSYISVDRPTTPTPVEGLCPSDDWEEWGSHCFYFSNDFPDFEIDTWVGAQAQCRALAGEDFPNTDLASVPDIVTNEWIFQNLLNNVNDGAWIGLWLNQSGMFYNVFW